MLHYRLLFTDGTDPIDFQSADDIAAIHRSLAMVCGRDDFRLVRIGFGDCILRDVINCKGRTVYQQEV